MSAKHKYDLYIDHFKFMGWCDIHRDNHAFEIIRNTFIAVHREGKTTGEEAVAEGVRKGAIYKRLMQYEAAVEEYRASK